jgi:hypothetical protein
MQYPATGYIVGVRSILVRAMCLARGQPRCLLTLDPNHQQ